MPITPFIGVRISWLTLARNSDLTRADSTAASRARASSSRIFLRSVMSRATAWNPTTQSPLIKVCTFWPIQTRSPSGFRTGNS